MRRTSNRVNNLDAFEQELTKLSGVKEVSIASSIPGDIPAFAFDASVKKGGSGVKTALFIANKEFLSSFDIKILEGSGFDKSMNSACVINTTCMKQLGYQKPDNIIGEKLYLQDESGMQSIEVDVLGVCRDFNLSNAKEVPDPIVLLDWTKDIMWGKYILSLDNHVNKKELLANIEKHFLHTFPNYPFEYHWLEDYYNKQYKQENSIVSSLTNFAIVAVLLGVLSLLSMVLNMSLARAKEIGIRKVNGARQRDIIKLLNAHFIKWIGFAALIAVPVSWYFLSNWVNTFAYQTNLSSWIFIVSTSLAFIIAILAVTAQSLKVACMNPVESIQYE